MAVGIFDSGLGGLTVYDAVARRLPFKGSDEDNGFWNKGISACAVRGLDLAAGRVAGAGDSQAATAGRRAKAPMPAGS